MKTHIFGVFCEVKFCFILKQIFGQGSYLFLNQGGFLKWYNTWLWQMLIEITYDGLLGRVKMSYHIIFES